MKKTLIITAAIIGGDLCNVLICVIALLVWNFNPGICILVLTAVILGFCALLNTVTKKTRKIGVKRGVFLACVQVPITVLAIVFSCRTISIIKITSPPTICGRVLGRCGREYFTVYRDFFLLSFR